MTPVQLPEVPAPCAVLERTWSATWFVGTDRLDHSIEQQAVYTAAQLQAYATEAVMAERARIAELATRWIDAAAWAESSPMAETSVGDTSIRMYRGFAAELTTLLTQPENNSGN